MENKIQNKIYTSTGIGAKSYSRKKVDKNFFDYSSSLKNNYSKDDNQFIQAMLQRQIDKI